MWCCFHSLSPQPSTFTHLSLSKTLNPGSCHLRVVPEKPSTSSNCLRRNKYHNNLCIVSHNHFSPVTFPSMRCRSSQLTRNIQVTGMRHSFSAESDSFHKSLSLKAINSKYIRKERKLAQKGAQQMGPLSVSGDADPCSKLEKLCSTPMRGLKPQRFLYKVLFRHLCTHWRMRKNYSSIKAELF